MRATLATIVLTLATAAPAWAAKPVAKIEGPKSAPAGGAIFLSASKAVSDTPIRWILLGADEYPFPTFDSGKREGVATFVPVAEAGVVYRFVQVSVGLDDPKAPEFAFAFHEVTVAPSKPPDPIKPPVDPVDPPPATVGNLRVLLLYESETPVTWGQLKVFHSSPVRDYLDAKCLPDGTVRAWRFWDDDQDASLDTPGWPAALAAARADPVPVPKVCVFAGTKLVASAPLPETEAEMLAYLKKYGGP